MFLRQMTDAFFVRTDPDSSMVNPAAIHITKLPHIRKESVLKINLVSSVTCAYVGVGFASSTSITVKLEAKMALRRNRPELLRALASPSISSPSIRFGCTNAFQEVVRPANLLERCFRH